MPIPLIAAAAASSLLGAVGSSVNNARARKTMGKFYDYAEDFTNSQANRSTFDTAGGRALLKTVRQGQRDNLDAINNRAVAGGATMENQLAARQANNESLDRAGMQLVQMDERNRRAWEEKGLAFAGQRAADEANRYYQNAQNWQAWGSAMGNSLMDFGAVQLLKGK